MKIDYIVNIFIGYGVRTWKNIFVAIKINLNYLLGI